MVWPEIFWSQKILDWDAIGYLEKHDSESDDLEGIIGFTAALPDWRVDFLMFAGQVWVHNIYRSY